MAVTWIEPKTNWLPTDRFNFVDYNRIKNNLMYIHELAVELYEQFDIEDMGDDITSYEAYWDAETFNFFERNIETINKNIYTQDFGDSQVFYPNGIFITYDELNRIESATLSMKKILDSQKSSVRRLSFRLGSDYINRGNNLVPDDGSENPVETNNIAGTAIVGKAII